MNCVSIKIGNVKKNNNKKEILEYWIIDWYNSVYSPAAYNFVIWGLNAVLKFEINDFTALFTWNAILRAAFTTGPKNILSNILTPCPLNIHDNVEYRVHPENVRSSL